MCEQEETEECGAHRDEFLHPHTRFISNHHSSKHTPLTEKYIPLKKFICVGLEVLAADGMKGYYVLGYKISGNFEGGYRLHLQD
jgi:hypothetical protein